MEMQSIFKLLYMLQVNLDIFLQKKRNWTDCLCFQANFLVEKKKNHEYSQKFYIGFFHPCLQNYEALFTGKPSVKQWYNW